MADSIHPCRSFYVETLSIFFDGLFVAITFQPMLGNLFRVFMVNHIFRVDQDKISIIPRIVSIKRKLNLAYAPNTVLHEKFSFSQ